MPSKRELAREGGTKEWAGDEEKGVLDKTVLGNVIMKPNTLYTHLEQKS